MTTTPHNRNAVHPPRGRVVVPGRSPSTGAVISTPKPQQASLDGIRQVSRVEQERPTGATTVSPPKVVTHRGAVHTAKRTRTSRHLAKTAKRADALSKSLRTHPVKGATRRKFSLKSFFFNPYTTGAVAALLIVLSGYVSIDTWLTNRRLQNELTTHAVSVQPAEKDTPATHQAGEGKDKTPLPANALADYHVAANQPRAVYIKKLNVAARLMPMNTNADGSMQAPLNIFDAGWYTGSSTAGQGGAVVIDGHASGDKTRLGLFGYLDTLEKGDTATIELGNGQKYTYQVAAKEIVDKDKVNMQKLMLPYGNAIKGANFITCTGTWEDDKQTLDKRAIIYMVQVG